ncbi:hypothetical protein PRIPAC_77351 [Pristionchus pacificus]|uniref:Uncharacterized protein n=1 Tax=Pristionchus pacificus TaxID=54126 RepID=A0A2A6CPV4_PRIPA|nr:hypothetical protein PRIPAC_77351 [Pristionchus pacificus]|eukprot:PDM80234.1 hypothetical protein PRIPAC_32813 [Pristionchus pacificus]
MLKLDFLRPIRIVLLVLATVGLIGTLTFCSFENTVDSETDAATYERLNAAIKTIADDLQRTARNEEEIDMEESVKNAYIKLLEIEGKWSTTEKSLNRIPSSTLE